jgi:hypothetical protein
VGSRRRGRLAGLSSFLVAGALALEPRGRGPKLLRMSVLELARGWGEGGDWGGGGDKFQRVTQAGQLRLSESFLDASVTFSCVMGGEHWLTSLLELPAEKGLPSDWYTSLAKWSRMMRAALCASRGEFFLRGLVFSVTLEWAGQKVRNSPGEEPRIIQFFCSISPLIGARSDFHWM